MGIQMGKAQVTHMLNKGQCFDHRRTMNGAEANNLLACPFRLGGGDSSSWRSDNKPSDV